MMCIYGVYQKNKHVIVVNFDLTKAFDYIKKRF